MDVLCDRDESPWFRVLSGMVFLINAGYRDRFFLSLMDLHLGENSTCLTFLSFWSGCSIKRVLPNTLDVQAQVLQWLSMATKGGPFRRVPRTFSLSVGKLGNQGKGSSNIFVGSRA